MGRVAMKKKLKPSDLAPLLLLQSPEEPESQTSTTDRLMGVSSVDLSDEEDGFGDGELTDTQEHDEEVANDLRDPR